MSDGAASIDEVVADDDRIAGRSDADDGDPCAAHLLEREDIVLRLDGKVVEAARSRDVVLPAREVLEDRLRVVEVGLADRQLVEPLAVCVAYRVMGASYQPTRRGRPVVVPNSKPRERRKSPFSSKSSVGKGPAPTRVV